jgi:hypothetical protein
MNPLGLLLIAGLFSVAQEKPVIPLPADPSSAIITMDRRGGFPRPRIDESPILTIRADGRLTVIDPWGNTGSKEAVLSPSEVQDLLRFAITEQDFFAFKALDVRRKIEAEFAKTGIGEGIADASDTVIRIKTANQEFEASYNALNFWSARFPDIKSLGQLRAIEIKLTSIVEELRAGGRSEIEAALILANAHIKREFPDKPAFTSDDYFRTLESVNGQRTMQFLRDQGYGANFVLSVVYVPGKPPQITTRTEARIMPRK